MLSQESDQVISSAQTLLECVNLRDSLGIMPCPDSLSERLGQIVCAVKIGLLPWMGTDMQLNHRRRRFVSIYTKQNPEVTLDPKDAIAVALLVLPPSTEIQDL